MSNEMKTETRVTRLIGRPNRRNQPRRGRRLQLLANPRSRVLSSLVELKHNDLNINGTQGTTAAVSPMTLLAQGSSSVTRLGVMVSCKHIRLRAVWSAATSQVRSVIYRVSVVRDRQCNGATPAATDVWSTATSPTSLVCEFNQLNRDRFEVLFDKVGLVAPVLTTPITSQVVSFDWTGRVDIRYVGTAADAASMGANNLFLLYQTDEATNPPNFLATTSFWFSDD